jgi:CheY-like chemotaxis protein
MVAETLKRILYVDDEESLALLGQEFLGDLGYQVDAAFSAAEALESFAPGKASYDLVVTDESMPSMSGIELAQELYRRVPQLPVILCSGHLLTMDEDGMADTNIRGVLVKTEVCLKLPEMIEALLVVD